MLLKGWSNTKNMTSRLGNKKKVASLKNPVSAEQRGEKQGRKKLKVRMETALI